MKRFTFLKIVIILASVNLLLFVQGFSEASFLPFRICEEYYASLKKPDTLCLDISDSIRETYGSKLKLRFPTKVNLGYYEYMRIVLSVNVEGRLRWGWKGEKTRDIIFSSEFVQLISDSHFHTYIFPIVFSDRNNSINNPIIDYSREIVIELELNKVCDDIHIREVCLLPHPLNIPRQFTIGGICMDSMWDECIEVKTKITEKTKLFFFTGIYEPKSGSFRLGEDVSWETDGVRFVVEVFGRSKKDTLFNYTMNPKDKIEDRKWRKQEIIIPEEFENQEVVIRFSIDKVGDTIGDFAVWGNPILISNYPYASEGDKFPVFLISCDTLRPDHLIPFGYSLPTSPNLDKFSKDAVVFENAYTTQTFTPVAHMSMLSGLYPQNHGLTRFTDVRNDVVLLPELLKREGYYTAGVVGFLWWFIPSRGFSRGMDYFSVPLDDEKGQRRNVFEVIKEAKDLLSTLKSEKVFMFLHNYDIHSTAYGDLYDPGKDFKIFSNYPAPPLPYVDGCYDTPMGRLFLKHAVEGDFVPSLEHIRYIRDLYDDCIFKVDTALGDFFEFLKEKSLYESSMIIVVSDHGESLGEHGLFGHDNVYEESIKCLMMVKFPYNKYAGVRVSDMVILEDILPTILETLSISDIVAGRDGIPFSKIIEGVGRLRDYVFSMSLRGDMQAIIGDKYKLFVDIPKGVTSIFDLSKSDGEYYNLKWEKKDIWKKLNQIYDKVFGLEQKGWWLVFVNRDIPWWNHIEVICSTPIVSAKMFRGVLRPENARSNNCIIRGELFLPYFDGVLALQIVPSDNKSEILLKIKDFDTFSVCPSINGRKEENFTFFSFDSTGNVGKSIEDYLEFIRKEKRYFCVVYYPFNYSPSDNNKIINEVAPSVSDILINLGYF